MLTFFAVIIFAVLLWVVPFLWQRGRLRYLRSRELPQKQISLLAQELALYRHLPPAQQRELQQNVSLFLRDKEFVGCDGLSVTDEMRIAVASHACLLLLQRDNNCYPELRTILMYPDAYIAEEIHREGYVESSRQSARAGEAHYRGPVVISWGDLRAGIANPQRGHNVAIHEFAHKLDEEDGYVDGRPPFANSEDGKNWAPVMREAFFELRERLHTLHEESNPELNPGTTVNAGSERRPSVLDTYGAQSPAEFFAVATEAYFIIPEQMEAAHPVLYRELQKFFRTDPAALLRSSHRGG
ncbi:zinc-dependent peptidase [Microbulbifer aggregans]|uniref:M90 family metallopeptidase n=1 Tax=Microbulbifer aggregans TaxID=1769779 RepID=UPI001CFE9197|nr:M90 family metallopeptidase [Microbulbifer aggregans]